MVKETKTLVATINTMVEAANTMVKIGRCWKFSFFNNLMMVSDHGL